MLFQLLCTLPSQESRAASGPPARVRGGRLAALALLGWAPVLGQAVPQVAPSARLPVTIRGVVLDDSLGGPVADAWLYLNDTPYGAVTDEEGKFCLTFPPDWKPVRGGWLVLKVAPIPFTFKAQQARLDWRTHAPAQVLTLRLASAPGRGRPHLHGLRWKPRPLPPPAYLAGRPARRP